MCYLSILSGCPLSCLGDKRHARGWVCLELAELLQGRGMVREQVHTYGGIFGNLDVPILNPIVQPILGDPQVLGQLRDRQIARFPAGMRLMAALHQAVLKPNRLYCTG